MNSASTAARTRCRTVTTGTPAARARSLGPAIAATVPAPRYAMATGALRLSMTTRAPRDGTGSP